MSEPLARFRVEEVVWKQRRSIRIREVLFGILYDTVFQSSNSVCIQTWDGNPTRVASPLKARKKLKNNLRFRNLRERERRITAHPNPPQEEEKREKGNSLFEFLASGSGEAREEGKRPVIT